MFSVKDFCLSNIMGQTSTFFNVQWLVSSFAANSSNIFRHFESLLRLRYNPQKTIVFNTAQVQFSVIIAALFNSFTIPHARKKVSQKI